MKIGCIGLIQGLLQFVFSFSFFKLTECASHVENCPVSLVSFLDAKTEVVFTSRPYDYEVYYPKSSSVKVSQELLDFNVCFTNFPEDFVMLFEKKYFSLFASIYPGLKDVSIRPFDVGCLIIFALLYFSEKDFTLFLPEFHPLLKEIASALEGQCPVILDDFLFNFTKDVSREALLKQLFQIAIKGGSFYTFEAFFATKLEEFTPELLQFAIYASYDSGDSRFIRRIASELDVSIKKMVLASALSDFSWPKSSYPSSESFIFIFDYGIETFFNFDEQCGKVIREMHLIMASVCRAVSAMFGKYPLLR